jgi:IS30 family transposase
MNRLARSGFGVREIGRVLNRDHHTVSRHVAPGRALDLATDLALQCHFAPARWVLTYTADPQDAAQVRDLISELKRLLVST